MEHELSWAPHFLERLDYTYTERRARRDWWYRFRNDATLPSDFFHSNVFLSFQEDALGIRDLALLGVNTLMWGSDYPHTEATFPRSQRGFRQNSRRAFRNRNGNRSPAPILPSLYHFDGE